MGGGSRDGGGWGMPPLCRSRAARTTGRSLLLPPRRLARCNPAAFSSPTSPWACDHEREVAVGVVQTCSSADAHCSSLVLSHLSAGWCSLRAPIAAPSTGPDFDSQTKTQAQRRVGILNTVGRRCDSSGNSGGVHTMPPLSVTHPVWQVLNKCCRAGGTIPQATEDKVVARLQRDPGDAKVTSGAHVMGLTPLHCAGERHPSRRLVDALLAADPSQISARGSFVDLALHSCLYYKPEPWFIALLLAGFPEGVNLRGCNGTPKQMHEISGDMCTPEILAVLKVTTPSLAIPPLARSR